MAKTIAIVVIVLLALLITSIIVVAIFAFNFFPFGEDLTTYEDTFSYQYEMDTPADIEEVLIETDVSKTYVEYTSEEAAPVVKVIMDFKITGSGAGDKVYTEWFEPIEWINDTSPITFRLDSKPTSFLEGNWFNENELRITLRSDIVFDLEVIVTTGGMEVIIPTDVVLEDLDLDSTTGLLQLDAKGITINKGITSYTTTGGNEIELTDCVIEGDITQEGTTGILVFIATDTDVKGITTTTTTGPNTMELTGSVIEGDISQEATTGLITYNTDDIVFTMNSEVTIVGSTGGVNFDINQDENLGADVSISMTTSTGSIDGTYIDSNSNVGARFAGETSTGGVNYNSPSGGFSEFANAYESSDYGTATHKYTVMLSTSTGSINLAASSA